MKRRLYCKIVEAKMQEQIHNLELKISSCENVRTACGAVILRTVEMINTAKRLAQMLAGHFITITMEQEMGKPVEERNTSILEEILYQGSARGRNPGIAFWRGVLISIVFLGKGKTEISKDRIESLKVIAEMENISN